jgi:hypothetical protein
MSCHESAVRQGKCSYLILVLFGFGAVLRLLRKVAAAVTESG